jgi:muramoyltetrapeptide carboxypeptidase
MTQPPFLQKGDKIGICATARWLTPEQWEPAQLILESWGLIPVIMPQVFVQNGQLAGTDEERVDGLMQCLKDPEIKAIMIARGGYGSVRVVDAIPDDVILNSNKWICGYSDVTVLHNRWNNLGLSTIHSTMPISFPSCTPLALSQLHGALMGHWQSRTWKGASWGWQDAEAPMVGGNLSVIYSQLGSPSQPKTAGCFLLLEDVDEMLYHLDRMMQGLMRSGLLNNVKGIVVGGLTQMKDNTQAFGFSMDNPWGKTAEEILLSYAQTLNLPIVFDFPSGHWEQNEAVYLGRPLRINRQENDNQSFTMELV